MFYHVTTITNNYHFWENDIRKAYKIRGKAIDFAHIVNA